MTREATTTSMTAFIVSYVNSLPSEHAKRLAICYIRDHIRANYPNLYQHYNSDHSKLIGNLDNIPEAQQLITTLFNTLINGFKAQTVPLTRQLLLCALSLFETEKRAEYNRMPSNVVPEIADFAAAFIGVLCTHKKTLANKYFSLMVIKVDHPTPDASLKLLKRIIYEDFTDEELQNPELNQDLIAQVFEQYPAFGRLQTATAWYIDYENMINNELEKAMSLLEENPGLRRFLLNNFDELNHSNYTITIVPAASSDAFPEETLSAPAAAACSYIHAVDAGSEEEKKDHVNASAPHTPEHPTVYVDETPQPVLQRIGVATPERTHARPIPAATLDTMYQDQGNHRFVPSLSISDSEISAIGANNREEKPVATALSDSVAESIIRAQVATKSSFFSDEGFSPTQATNRKPCYPIRRYGLVLEQETEEKTLSDADEPFTLTLNITQDVSPKNISQAVDTSDERKAESSLEDGDLPSDEVSSPSSPPAPPTPEPKASAPKRPSHTSSVSTFWTEAPAPTAATVANDRTAALQLRRKRSNEYTEMQAPENDNTNKRQRAAPGALFTQ